jgi:hypothetical protein
MKTTGMEDNSEAKPLAQIERHSYSEVGWISRQNPLALRSRENFFLDIPFYRTGFECDGDFSTVIARLMDYAHAGGFTRIYGNHSGFEVLSRDIAVSSLTQYFQGGSTNEF